jgi:SAM-dependent methyltransferase
MDAPTRDPAPSLAAMSPRPPLEPAKQRVYEYWNDAACGEELYLPATDRAGYAEQARIRYELEPRIFELARFDSARHKRILEIGVGLGADHQKFAEAGADLYGIDLTERAIEHTSRRLGSAGLASQLAIGDAEQLDFPDESFDIVYSWGVLHHTPDTAKAIAEVHRVLRQGGEARIMVYHKWSLVGFMLWIRYAIFGLRFWLSMKQIYARYLESPGTKAYSVSQARRLFVAFRDVRVTTYLSHADLLESPTGQRHKGGSLAAARHVWPRTLLRRLVPTLGLSMLIEARK